VFVVCQGLRGNEPVGIEKSLDQRIVTVVVEIGSRLVYFVSVVGEIGSRLVCPCCRRHKLVTGTEAISDSSGQDDN
jgi:hypothetical protein